MNSVNYKPILPDDLYSSSQSTNVEDEFIHPKNKEQKQDINNSKDYKKKHYPIPVNLTQNKVLITGMIIVIIILLIIITIIVIKHRRESSSYDSPYNESEDKNNEKLRNKKSEYKYEDDSQNQRNKVEENKTIDNYILRQYMEKRKHTPDQDVKKPISAMGQKNKIEKQHMNTIEEDDTNEFVDKEYSKTRETIGGLLNEYDKDYDDSMVMPDDNKNNDKEIVKKYTKVIEDETIEEQSVNDEADDEEDQVVLICESVLVSGKRSGQQCERKCTDGSNLCGRHKGK
jgi:Na+-transporting methylmalonyl-CoA/oxaloacetate decarboxylase gamma subunit